MSNPNQEIQRFRRIVTGIDQQGKGLFESDDQPEITFTAEEQCPGYNIIEMWQTETIPPSFDDKHNVNERGEYHFNLAPGETRFGTMRLPPIKALIAHHQALGNEIDLSTFGMHRTDTIDYCTLLSGEITLILEDGAEKTLYPGDCSVLRGALHAWHNRGDVPCYMSWVLIGTEPLAS